MFYHRLVKLAVTQSWLDRLLLYPVSGMTNFYNQEDIFNQSSQTCLNFQIVEVPVIFFETLEKFSAEELFRAEKIK